MIIDLPRFIATERPTWTELEELLDKMGREPDFRLGYSGATRFHYLYQKVSADLARLATFASEPQLRRYLEALVARAYSEIHETRGRGPRLHPARWLLHDFPAAFRRRSSAFVMALLVTLAGAGFGGFAVTLDPDAKEALVPAQFGHLMGDPAERVRKEEQAAKDRLAGSHATFAGALMTNNIRVSILAMALGMSWGGIGTFLLLFYNGIIVGLVAIDYIQAGQTVFLLGWLMPHGVIEIPAVLIGGQAGLVLGGAFLRRGERISLARRLRAVAPDVITLIGGVAVMLVWAGMVESFLSQHHQPVLPYWLKISFGCVELFVLIWLLSGHIGSRLAPAPSTPTS